MIRRVRLPLLIIHYSCVIMYCLVSSMSYLLLGRGRVSHRCMTQIRIYLPVTRTYHCSCLHLIIYYVWSIIPGDQHVMIFIQWSTFDVYVCYLLFTCAIVYHVCLRLLVTIKRYLLSIEDRWWTSRVPRLLLSDQLLVTTYCALIVAYGPWVMTRTINLEWWAISD